jgi:hypothetical protein
MALISARSSLSLALERRKVQVVEQPVVHLRLDLFGSGAAASDLASVLRYFENITVLRLT